MHTSNRFHPVYGCVLILVSVMYFNVEAKCPAGLKNKTYRRDLSRICPACIEVSWLIRPPFTFQNGNYTSGILPALLDLMLTKCCGNHTPSCWQVTYHPPVKNPEQLLRLSRDSHVIYPVIVDKQEAVSLDHNLISLIPPSSIGFVVPRGKRESFPKKLLMSVFEAWPVLILTILLSILAGVLLWVLDTWFNEEQFPRNFFRGSWEGFWWAFVSMTTVGYGDRAPISLLGRTFAVCWILIGICICSIFTATLTTSLTTISLDTKKSLPGSKVGVIKRSIEMALAMQQQADIELYNSVEEMSFALDNGVIEGVLLDNYQISHYTETLFPDSKFKTDEIIKVESLSYGAVVNDTYLRKCFRRLIAEDKYLLYDFTRNELTKTLKGGGDDEAVQNSQSIFDPTGDLFYPSLYTCIALVVIIFLVGVVTELFCFRTGRCKLSKKGGNPSDAIPFSKVKGDTALDQLEQEMLGEVQALFNKYRDRLEEVKNQENNGNAMSMHSTV
ncbi:unnamed protein product [Porites lobata]|uniref:Potassium channel domain-containing protein n=1 Tax=Porites lobata TaxID=104759 RepID=A0ABN8PB31_9CNID|nr:unnamed protein product [Porites lobata]